MATINEIARWEESHTYLTMLRDTLAGDVRPLVALPGGAPFAIFRETMSYIDHLGHLYSGREKVGDRFLSFLRGPLATVDDGYAKRADELYQMYRNGPVHEFEPKYLENDRGQRLGWLSYRGNRKSQHLPTFGIFATHLEPVAGTGAPNSYYLPVSSNCLIDDLERAIDAFIVDTNHATRVTAWNRAARRIRPPQGFNFKV
jgi:hypothetical protein